MTQGRRAASKFDGGHRHRPCLSHAIARTCIRAVRSVAVRMRAGAHDVYAYGDVYVYSAGSTSSLSLQVLDQSMGSWLDAFASSLQEVRVLALGLQVTCAQGLARQDP